MEYKTIRLLSFELQGKRTELEEIYSARIKSDSTVTLPINIHEFPMFFVITPELTNLITRIYKKNTELQILCVRTPDIAIGQYTRSILIDEIGLTNEMENIHSTRREIEDSLDDVEQHGGKKSRMRFAGMIEKYNRLQHKDIVDLRTCQNIRALYDDLVLPEVLREDPKDAPDGEIFRKGTVLVQDSHRETIHEGVYPETEIIKEMEEALSLLSDSKIPMLIRIAAFHYLFAYIHPFYNGNGRMTRFISSYLISQELCSEASLRLSAVIKEKKTKYYRMFKDTNEKRNRGDLTGFIYAFLEFVSESLDNCYDFIHEKNTLLANFHKVLDVHKKVPKKHDVLWILIQNALFSESGLSIQQLIGISGKGRTSVEKELHIYETEWHVINIQKEGKKYIYQLSINKLLSVLEELED